jgi:hypothetical protein
MLAELSQKDVGIRTTPYYFPHTPTNTKALSTQREQGFFDSIFILYFQKK